MKLFGVRSFMFVLFSLWNLVPLLLVLLIVLNHDKLFRAYFFMGSHFYRYQLIDRLLYCLHKVWFIIFWSLLCFLLLLLTLLMDLLLLLILIKIKVYHFCLFSFHVLLFSQLFLLRFCHWWNLIFWLIPGFKTLIFTLKFIRKSLLLLWVQWLNCVFNNFNWIIKRSFLFFRNFWNGWAWLE